MRQDARGEKLSGGEQQMLAIGRALCAPQKLILLDEPFKGSVVAEVLTAIEQIRSKTSILFRAQGSLSARPKRAVRQR
jgi:branched-chain amino acid transport system ATP-binding protein